MKIPTSVIQAVAAAVLAASVTSCTTDDISPEKGKKEDKTWESCPACGLG